MRDFLYFHIKNFMIFALLCIFSSCDGSNETSNSQQGNDKSQATNKQKGLNQYDKSTISKPARAFRQCLTCHNVQNEQQKLIRTVGPNLFDIYNQKAGQKYEFRYSKALSESDIIWNDENLDAFLTNPHKYIPGTRMSFRGIDDVETRRQIIIFLKEQSYFNQAKPEQDNPEQD